ncbi:MAG TPA: YpmS family protein [Bacillota bacterium]|nr:YpmS family protein [Bacillota bacterium]
MVKNISWKRLFYILLSLNILIVLCITFLIFSPVASVDKPESEPIDLNDRSQFVVRTTKGNLNDLMNAYITKFLKQTEHKYSVTLEDDVLLEGELPVFSSTVPLSVRLEPVVEDNGHLILKQQSIALGSLQLPNKKIMEYMAKYLPVPEWVTILPQDQEIYVSLQDLNLKSNFDVRVNTFDLEANDLSFTFYVPYKTLGIDPLPVDQMANE